MTVFKTETAYHPISPPTSPGHLMQALVVLSTVGGGIARRVSLRADSLAARRIRVAVARHEARISLAEHQLDQRHTEERQFQA